MIALLLSWGQMITKSLVFDEGGLLAKYPRWCLYIELP